MLNKHDLRARVLTGRRGLRAERLTIDDAGTEVEIRGLTAGDAFRVKAAAREEDGEINNEKFYPGLIIKTAYVPGTNDALFSEGDRDELLELPYESIELMAMTAMRLSGLAPDAVKALEKNSGAAASTTTAAGSSDSPSAST